ncbi:MAG: DUF1080 domain-containing protein [Verrucomicrobia bacterium]|nr:DUF1080 domain-containing protein [Verrucomicrobiota bacterium]
MKTLSLIQRILITAGVILSATGPCLAQTGEWRQLFNGKDMKGWEQVGPGKFEVEDGKLKSVGGMGMLLYPAEKFGDVVIRVVYTVKDNDCNSGVFIRIPEKPKDEWAAVNAGYEVQIDHGKRHVGGEYHCTGVLYSLTKALSHPQRKPGEWNEFEITLDGPRTIVVLNGQKVTDYREGDPVPPKTRDFEPTRGARPLTGYIGVQNHDALSTVYFREIAVKKLPGKLN